MQVLKHAAILHQKNVFIIIELVSLTDALFFVGFQLCYVTSFLS
jgi:hypothetical protein